jgi:hypothetical protein
MPFTTKNEKLERRKTANVLLEKSGAKRKVKKNEERLERRREVKKDKTNKRMDGVKNCDNIRNANTGNSKHCTVHAFLHVA